MSQLYNMKSVYPMVKTLYDLEPDTESFEDVALVGWEIIGNRHTRLYRFVADTENQEIKLPCNADVIESVHLPINDAQVTSNKIDYIDTDAIYVENYIEAWNHNDSEYYQKGKLVDYREGDGVLYFNRDYKNVTIIYHGVLVDEEDGLPLVNEREIKALASFVAYRSLVKAGIAKRDKDALSLAQLVEKEWLRNCNAARLKDHFSQNDMNAILDVKTRWDRKIFHKSLKPIL